MRVFPCVSVISWCVSCVFSVCLACVLRVFSVISRVSAVIFDFRSSIGDFQRGMRDSEWKPNAVDQDRKFAVSKLSVVVIEENSLG